MARPWWQSRDNEVAVRYYGKRLVVPYGVCVRCAGYQALRKSGLCWDCAPRPRWGPVHEPWASVVYYGARDGLVKIGTSNTVYTRMHQLGAILLGTEPGTHALECERHRQFAASRTYGRGLPCPSEWFGMSADLRAHIRDLPDRPHARMLCVG
jgi:hypothetical protein